MQVDSITAGRFRKPISEEHYDKKQTGSCMAVHASHDTRITSTANSVIATNLRLSNW